jgi:hypothetical protein
MKKVLMLAAVGEAATGVALLTVPSLVGWLLFGEELAGVVIPVACVTGYERRVRNPIHLFTIGGLPCMLLAVSHHVCLL